MNIENPPKWKIACFDLDGTLVRGTSTGQHLAEKIGHAKEMKQIETLNRYGKASNADVAALDSKYYSGYKKADIHLYLEDIPPGAFRRLFVLLPGVSLQNISPNVMALSVGVVQIYVLIRKAYLREKYFLTLLKRTNLVLLKLSVKKRCKNV